MAAAPFYQQLNQELRLLVRSGEFGPGHRFLTERQVAERFSTSRPTANKALAALVAEGLLEFRKGVGTFVRAPRLDYDLRQLLSFTAKAQQAGMTPSTRVIALARIPAGPAAQTGLAVGEGTAVFYIERLRLADGDPVILERRWVPVAISPRLTRRELAGSIYSYWTNRCGLVIDRAEQVIRAVNLSPGDAALLGSTKRSAALLLCARGFLQDGRVLWYEETLYRGDRYEFCHQHAVSGRLLTGAVV